MSSVLDEKWIEEEHGYESPCWVWQRGCTPGGYGETWLDRKVVYAHRVSYEEHVGPIPEGLCVHHKCEVRRCLNPDHLELVSRRDHSGKAGHGKITMEDAREIRRRHRPGQPGAPSRHREIDRGNALALATEFGLTRGTVMAIVQGQRWREPAVPDRPA